MQAKEWDTRAALSEEVPPPPQLSPDGRYYWDGQRWTPVQQPTLPQPGPSAIQPMPQPITQYAPPVQVQAVPLMVYRPPTNGLATTSLVFGIVSWFLCPLIGSIVAVTTGHAAHSQIKRTGESGGGMATAGMVLGYINLTVTGLFLLFWLVVLGGLTVMLGAIGASTVPRPSP